MDTRTPETVAAPAAEAGRETPAPLVSIIVGVYNKERFVGECLRSVLAQTYQHWELIVVDDASTDNSLAEVERAVGRDPRVRLIRRATNSGHPGVVRNQALREAKGKYVAFLDADDLWKPEKLAVQTAYMEAHAEYPLSHTVCEEIDESGKVLHTRHGGKLPPPGDCLEALFAHCFICTSTVMVRRDFGERLGWFTESPGYECGEDYDFFVRCARENGIGIPSGVWAAYRNVGESISHRAANWKNRPADYMRKVFFLRRNDLWKGRVSAATMRRLAWQAAEENCRYWRARSDFAKASWFAWQAMSRAPFRVSSWRQMAGALLRRR